MPMCAPWVDNPIGRTQIVTSGTRPTGSLRYVGAEIFETDTSRKLLWDGTGWIVLAEPTQSYTPGINGLTVGNGTLTGRYHRSDGWCDVTVRFALGTTSAVTGRTSFSLPYASSTDYNLNGWAAFYEGGGDDRLATILTDGPNVFIDPVDASSTYARQALCSSTVPFTWGSSDMIAFAARYRMASRYS